MHKGERVPLDTESVGSQNAESLQNLKPRTWSESTYYGLFICLGTQVLALVAFLLAMQLLSSDSPMDYSCLYAVGGGVVRATGGFPQDRLHNSNSGCSKVISNYLKGGQYDKDLKSAGDQAMEYYMSKDNFPQPSSSDLLVFDIDETVLSNMAEFVAEEWGLNADPAIHDRFVLKAESPPIQPIKDVYIAAYNRGMSVTFITGRTEMSREGTVRNLKAAGFGEQCQSGSTVLETIRTTEPCYVKLDLRDTELDMAKPASVYKPERRQILENAGYEVVGSFGDQFSDLEGTNEGVASWKLPNPMYYIL